MHTQLATCECLTDPFPHRWPATFVAKICICACHLLKICAAQLLLLSTDVSWSSVPTSYVSHYRLHTEIDMINIILDCQTLCISYELEYVIH